MLSAGLLMYRLRDGQLEVLLVHPGGPYFEKKDLGSWSIPKGLVAAGEAAVSAARREFLEETGFEPPLEARLVDLGEVLQASGKRVRVWAFEGDCDPRALASNSFEMEWPPRSGRRRSFPEVDRAEFFRPDRAVRKLIPAQTELVERLIERLLESP
jgi:predicted NUDIX family NTP pyrophosphohydrolase